MSAISGTRTIAAFPRYLAALRQIAEARKVPILQRFAIMKYLVTSAQYTPQQLLAPDLFHPNDFTYGCLGRFLADALQDEVRRAIYYEFRRRNIEIPWPIQIQYQRQEELTDTPTRRQFLARLQWILLDGVGIFLGGDMRQ